MSAKEVVKKNIAGLHVIKTLLLLLEDSFTMSEIVSKLNERERDAIFNSNVVSKYINTCRYCGIEIPKINNKYSVVNVPFGINIDAKDLKILDEFKVVAQKILTTKLNNVFVDFLEKLNKYSNRKITRVEKRTIEAVCEDFELAVFQKRKILLGLKTKTSLEVNPNEFVEIKEKKYFKVFDDYNKEYLIPFDKVSTLEILDKKMKENEKIVTFKLYKGLAKRYALREHEVLRNSDKDSITIANSGEDKEVLLSRLLRYDDCCEIISPKEYRDEMKILLNQMLENYGE